MYKRQVPDPISEAQKKEYANLKDYIQAVIVPDMQKKLRQGFGPVSYTHL